MRGDDASEFDSGSATTAKAIERAFGFTNRDRLLKRYFACSASEDTAPSNAWKHVYRLLLWPDPTTGLAHCYESDKSQPGKPWYARSLAFHGWLCEQFQVEPSKLTWEIDWLFIKACEDLTAAVLRREKKLKEAAELQRRPYQDRGFPESGTDPELVAIIQHALRPFFAQLPLDDDWNALTRGIRSYLAVQNKRKNLVGDGFEDVLSQVVRRTCQIPSESVLTRKLLYEIPGFNRSRQGGKENKVDLAIVTPSMRTLVTAKWSVRADREKQFSSEFDEYCNASATAATFDYVFVTNEFDPARLMRACVLIVRNSHMFHRVVHINTDALRAAYADVAESRNLAAARSRKRVIEHVDNGRLISLEQWLNQLSLF